MSLYSFLTSAALLWIALPAPVGAAIQEARVSGGTVMGTINNGVASFRGIPFAAPPVGPPCAQPPGSENHSAEDCLFLNVWTGATNAADRRPVMVWIHGGGFNRGATWSPTFDGSRFAEQGVVLVSVAYRLGVFGFLAHPQLSRESGKGSGAYALQDQIAALKWRGIRTGRTLRQPRHSRISNATPATDGKPGPGRICTCAKAKEPFTCITSTCGVLGRPTVRRTGQKSPMYSPILAPRHYQRTSRSRI